MKMKLKEWSLPDECSFLYPAEGSKFERDAILQCFRELSCLTEFELEPDGYALCRGRFDFEGESNLINLQRSLEAVVLGRLGRAACKAAMEIQSKYPFPLMTTDESYCAEIGVYNCQSFDELLEKFIADGA
jgi:hypothetical protein